MSQIIEALQKLPLEAQIAYGIIGALMLVAFFLWPLAIYYPFRLLIAAPAWIAREFSTKKGDRKDDDNTPAA